MARLTRHKWRVSQKRASFTITRRVFKTGCFCLFVFLTRRVILELAVYDWSGVP